MRKYALTAAVAVVAMLIAAPASAYVLDDSSVADPGEEAPIGEGAGDEEVIVDLEPTPLPPTKRTEHVYFHCAGDVPIDNVTRAQGTVAGWDTTAPTDSVQDGAGCGNADGAVENVTAELAGTPADQSSSTDLDAVFSGTFTGNLDSLTVTLYRIPGPVDRALNELGPEWWGAVYLKIDGAAVELESNSVVVPGEKSNSDVTDHYSFSIKNLGLMIEEGDGTTARTIELRLDHDSIESNGFLAWDTTEVPAGIVFNPSSLAQTVLTKV